MDNDGVLIDNFSIEDLPNNILRDIYQYWLVMKGNQTFPNRSDLHPTDIISLLPYISLIDVDYTTQRYKMRLVGTETVKALGKDITGKYLDEVPEIEKHLKERYEWIVKEKRPYFVSGKLRWSTKSFLNFSSVGLPLSNTGKNVDIIMYGSYFQIPGEARTEYPAGTDWKE